MAFFFLYIYIALTSLTFLYYGDVKTVTFMGNFHCWPDTFSNDNTYTHITDWTLIFTTSSMLLNSNEVSLIPERIYISSTGYYRLEHQYHYITSVS